MKRTLWMITIAASLGGCQYYQNYRIKKSTADVNEEHAANMRAYRECMQRNEHNPNRGQICGAYQGQ